jgi:serine/threonine protein kinase
MASKRQRPPSELSGPTVTPAVGISLIRRLVEAARTLQSSAKLAHSDIQAWNDEAADYLAQALGAGSSTIKSVLHTGGDVGLWSDMSEADLQRELQGQLANKIKLLNSCIRRLETSIEIAGAPPVEGPQPPAPPRQQSSGAPNEFETATERYTRVRIIGEGGSGRVFLAKNSAGEEVAIKCLHPAQATTDRRRRFRNELYFLRRNTHKNIVTVLDDGLVNWDGATTPFYVMPRYAMTLRHVMQQGLSPDRVLPVFSQILDGVEAAHLQRVIHRDLKPENVLADTSNHYAVADFGVSHFEEEDLLTAVETKIADRLANFLYAAPEQRIRGGTVTAGADLFALGLILNEMFTGSVIQGTGFKKIASVSENFSYLDDVVDRLVQNDASARYLSIDDLKMDLIASRNTFVGRQILAQQSGRVVSSNTPGEIEPVTLMGADWDGGVLRLELNRAPELGWVQRFKQPNEGYTSLMGSEPQRFNFTGTTASIAVDGNNAQTVVNHFKNYLQMATRSYQRDMNEAAAKRDREERAELEKQKKAAAERARVITGLKI